MTTYITNGPTQLSGTVSLHGAKNTALKYIFFPVFLKTKVLLTNIPKCTSINTGLNLLEQIGCTHEWQGNDLTIDSTSLKTGPFLFDANTFFHTSGAVLLSTILCELYGEVTIENTNGYSDTGGDPLERTLEKHHNFIKQYGYKIIDNGTSIKYIKTNNKFFVVDPKNTFGHGFGALSSAIFRDGTSIIKNYANIQEMNHVIDTLNNLGASIERKAGDLYVQGPSNFKHYQINNCFDKQECITYISLALTTESSITIKNANAKEFKFDTLDSFLKESGIQLIYNEANNTILVPKQTISDFKPVTFIAAEYPLPATEWQVLFSPLIGLIQGKSTIIDKYYPTRVQHWNALNLLGARGKIIKDNFNNFTGEVKVEGVNSFHEGKVTINAVREVCLLIAGLTVKGRIVINDPKDHIKRGYESFVENVIELGGYIEMRDEK